MALFGNFSVLVDHHIFQCISNNCTFLNTAPPPPLLHPVSGTVDYTENFDYRGHAVKLFFHGTLYNDLYLYHFDNIPCTVRFDSVNRQLLSFTYCYRKNSVICRGE
jgi:hypothetical protein